MNLEAMHSVHNNLFQAIVSPLLSGQKQHIRTPVLARWAISEVTQSGSKTVWPRPSSTRHPSFGLLGDGLNTITFKNQNFSTWIWEGEHIHSDHSAEGRESLSVVISTLLSFSSPFLDLDWSSLTPLQIHKWHPQHEEWKNPRDGHKGRNCRPAQ